MVYQGHVQNGIVVLDGDARLAEGTLVTVQPFEALPIAVADDPVYRLGELAAPTGITDLATNIDHYLYGDPKATDVP
jgi:hypothetical protein